MMNKTTTSVYRIFLSSTAIDMKEHRKKVIDAILRMGDLPVAMETFGALPNESVEVCKNKVCQSNALVVMVAHRYGWVPGPGEGGDGVKSITRIEMETALNEGIPVFAFLVDAGGEIAGALVGIQQAKLIRLAERLHHQGLVYTYKRQDLLTYTAHPFLREYFRDLLGVPSEKIHEAVRSKLAVGLDSKPKTKPREPDMLDRYEALIEYSILSGHIQEACDLFKNAMGGGEGSEHLYHTVGDYGRIIRVLSLFSADGEPRHLAPQLSLRNRSYLINLWGLAAICHSMGKIPAALENFTKAAEILGQPLFSTDGIYEAEHFFTLGNKTKAYERAEENLAQCERIELPRDVAMCHTLLGLFSLPGSIYEARSHLKKAREWTDQSGHMEINLRAHILAAEIAYCSGDFAAASATKN